MAIREGEIQNANTVDTDLSQEKDVYNDEGTYGEWETSTQLRMKTNENASGEDCSNNTPRVGKKTAADIFAAVRGFNR